jgi:hypothetical protein
MSNWIGDEIGFLEKGKEMEGEWMEEDDPNQLCRAVY